MGIPKFYRWISERYPCLSEKIREYQIPEFDNLYLDMNGIIHSCSHPNDEDIHLRIPEKNIFHDIFRYIDFLLKMIKPRKTFFMAIDGVAPRAKMNQQRGRRFRSAKLAEDQEKEALRKGEVLPSEERFDSNCITPGTEFMARLHLQLQYFVKVKVSTDPLWQREGLTIYLSGHDVPGEGEHKIMDYIRHIRSQPDYDPETRHCLYGLDADLIMLGLSTHELRFSLLREEVKFTKNKKPRKPNTPAPRPKNQLASYDLSNVSIFSSENGGVGAEVSRSDVSAPTAAISTFGAKSFAEMAKLEAQPAPEKVKNVNQEVDLMPPMPHDEFAKGTYKPPLPEKTTFLLLHLSLLRDYIDEEFQGLRQALERHPDIEYDLEKVIDDWILLSILVGNDFIPNLPKLHIVKGAFPMLYGMYAELLPSLGGYLNESGVLNLERFEKFLIHLSSFDLETFRETYDDMKYMESKTGKNIVLGDKMFVNFGFEGEQFEEEELEPTSELQALVSRTNAEVFGSPDKVENGGSCADAFIYSDDFFDPDDSPEFRLEFFQYKRNYYMEKMEMTNVTRDAIQKLAEEYVRAVQWILFYYYKGVSSWGWFYPGHYAPFTSDVRNFASYDIKFEMGKPFKPFEQLLGVLPAQSKKFLPECFQGLMIDENSPILEFYPNQFENDLNGKKQDWEAVVLIPFIQETRLLSAMNDVVKLTPEEFHRNSRGTMHCISFKKEDSGPIASPNDVFPAFPSSHYEENFVDEVGYNIALLPKGIHPGAKKTQIYQGFPSLKSIAHTSCMERGDIKIFEFPTREDSMILTIPSEMSKTQDLANELLGKTVWVNWPHLTFALVTGVSDQYQKFIRQYDSKAAKVIKDESFNPKTHNVVSKSLIEKHMKFKGIRLEEVNVIIWAKSMEGRKLRFNSQGEVNVETQWGRFEQSYALQTTIHTKDVTEIFYLDRIQHKSYKDVFQAGEKVFKLENPCYGSLGTVVGCENGEVQVELDCSVADPEENLGISLGTLKSRDYYQAYEAAKRLSIPSYTLARITGTVFVLLEQPASKRNGKLQKKKKIKVQNGKKVDELALRTLKSTSDDSSDSASSEEFQMNGKARNENIGLSLKFNKRNLEVRGYTRKVDGQWQYSMKAINLVKEYIRTFPEVLHFFQNGGGSGGSRDYYNASEIYPENSNDNVKLILKWIDDKGIKDLARVSMNSNILDDDDVHDVWTHVLEKKSANSTLPKKTAVLSLNPNSLYKPGINRGCVSAYTPDTRFVLLDRVVCVDPCAPLPLGQRGTIVGMQDPPEQAQQEEEAFRSTSSTVLKTFVILSDPIQDVFDASSGNNTPPTEGAENMKTDSASSQDSKDETANLMSSALQSLLRISLTDPSTSSTQSSTFASSSNDIIPPKRGKPTLVMLYPFQVLNLSQNAQKLADAAVMRHHEDYRQKSVQSQRILKSQAATVSTSLSSYQHKSNSIQEQLFPKRRERLELQKPSSNLEKNLSHLEMSSGFKTFAPTKILQRNVLQTTKAPSTSASAQNSSSTSIKSSASASVRTGTSSSANFRFATSAWSSSSNYNYFDSPLNVHDPVGLNEYLKGRYEAALLYQKEYPSEPVPDHKLTKEKLAERKKNRHVKIQMFKGACTGKPLCFHELNETYNPDLVPADEQDLPLLPSLKAYLEYFGEKVNNDKQCNVNVGSNGNHGHSSGQTQTQTQKPVLPKLDNASANKNTNQAQVQHQKSTMSSASGIQTQVYFRSPEKTRPQKSREQPPQQTRQVQQQQQSPSKQQHARSEPQQSLQSLLRACPAPQTIPAPSMTTRSQKQKTVTRPVAQPGPFHEQTQGLLQMLRLPTNSVASQPQPGQSIIANAPNLQSKPQSTPAQMKVNTTYSQSQPPPPGQPVSTTTNELPPPSSRGRGRPQRVNNPFVPLQVDRAATSRRPAASVAAPGVPGISAADRRGKNAGSVSATNNAVATVATLRKPTSPTYPGLSVLLSGFPSSKLGDTNKNDGKPKKSRIAANFGPVN